jgi:hypothetical protein
MYTHPLAAVDIALILFAMAPTLRRPPERRAGAPEAG